MIKVAYTNTQSKNKINGLISDLITLMRGVRQGCPVSILLYIIAAEVLANFIDTNKRIKGIHIVNFVDNTIIFLQDITCLDRIQKILKLYEDAFNSKIKFQKLKPYRLEHIKIELMDQDKWNGHNFSLKNSELILVTLSLITPIGTK